MKQKGFTIKRPEDEKTIGILRRKRKQYAERLEQISSVMSIKNERQLRKFYNTSLDYYKLAIDSEILDFGMTDSFDLSLNLFREEESLENKNCFSVNNFDMAFGVIQDYCLTGGKNLKKYKK